MLMHNIWMVLSDSVGKDDVSNLKANWRGKRAQEKQNLMSSLTIPGQRRHRKRCFERLDPAGQTHCAGYWGAAHILGLNTPSWPWGRRSTSSAGSSGRPSHSAHRGDNGSMDGWLNKVTWADTFWHIHFQMAQIQQLSYYTHQWRLIYDCNNSDTKT